MNPYEDILDLPHPTSRRHPPMSRGDRAAQFAPFAALTGYEDAVKETARLTSTRVELTEDMMAFLNRKLAFLCEHIDSEPYVAVTYFQPDPRKAGGAYVTEEGTLRRVDDVAGVLELSGRRTVPLREIISLESDAFGDAETL